MGLAWRCHLRIYWQASASSSHTLFRICNFYLIWGPRFFDFVRIGIVADSLKALYRILICILLICIVQHLAPHQFGLRSRLTSFRFAQKIFLGRFWVICGFGGCRFQIWSGLLLNLWFRGRRWKFLLGWSFLLPVSSFVRRWGIEDISITINVDIYLFYAENRIWGAFWERLLISRSANISISELNLVFTLRFLQLLFLRILIESLAADEEFPLLLLEWLILWASDALIRQKWFLTAIEVFQRGLPFNLPVTHVNSRAHRPLFQGLKPAGLSPNLFIIQIKLFACIHYFVLLFRQNRSSQCISRIFYWASFTKSLFLADFGDFEKVTRFFLKIRILIWKLRIFDLP